MRTNGSVEKMTGASLQGQTRTMKRGLTTPQADAASTRGRDDAPVDLVGLAMSGGRVGPQNQSSTTPSLGDGSGGNQAPSNKMASGSSPVESQTTNASPSLNLASGTSPVKTQPQDKAPSSALASGS